MKEERLAILKLIDEGKISASEGVKLLNALRDDIPKREFEIEDGINKVTSAMDSFAKDIKEKFCDFTKDAEPRMKKASQSIIEKTSEIFGEISKNLKDMLSNDDENDDKEEKENINENIDNTVVYDDKEKKD